MDIDAPVLLYLLLFSTAAMLAAACLTMLRFERRVRQFESFWASPTGASLAAGLSATAATSKEDTATPAPDPAIDKRLLELQRAVRTLAERQLPAAGPKSAEPPAPRAVPIENAVRMARLGASVEDLSRNFGLNVGEARLMQKMYGGKAPRARLEEAVT